MRKLNLKELLNNPDIYRSYYTYTLSLDSLTAGETATDILNIENDSQFVWTKTTYFADVAGTPQTNNDRVIPLISMQITDSGSARQFFDEPQPINSIAGQGAIPFILPSPFVFSNNANINASFTNFSAGTDYSNITLSLQGFRVYEYSNSLTGFSDNESYRNL